MQIPCTKDCGGRNAECHSQCERYKKWKEYKEQQKQERLKITNIEQYYITQCAKQRKTNRKK